MRTKFKPDWVEPGGCSPVRLVLPTSKRCGGKGLLIGVELQPGSGPARTFCESLMERGMLCKETHESVIRFAPPLVIEREDIDWALSQVREVLS